MAGVNDNLRPKPFTSETTREAGRKGGIASGIAKRRKANVTFQTGAKFEAFFAAMRSFYNAKQCFFREKPEFNGANTLAECVAHSKAY